MHPRSARTRFEAVRVAAAQVVAVKAVRVTRWYGRLGNNIQQVINAIDYALQHVSREPVVVQFPRVSGHHVFSGGDIWINAAGDRTEVRRYDVLLEDVFFFCDRIDLVSSWARKREIGIRYILPLLKKIISVDPAPRYDVSLHVRGGDIMSQANVCTVMIPPPLKFYTDIVTGFQDKRIALVCENDANPCAPILTSLPGVDARRMDMWQDVERLVNSRCLAFGITTFPIIACLVSPHLRHVIVPRFVIDLFVQAWGPFDFGDDVTVHVAETPGYLSRWTNSEEDRRAVIDHADVRLPPLPH